MQTHTRLRGHFSQILKEQSGEKWFLGVFTNSIEIGLCLMKNLGVRVVVDYADTQIFELCYQISLRKQKPSRKRFCLFIWGPDGIF